MKKITGKKSFFCNSKKRLYKKPKFDVKKFTPLVWGGCY